MNASCTKRACTTALLVLTAATVGACSGTLGTGGAPTTTAKPLSARDMCTRGQNAFTEVDELDRTKPDFLEKAKTALKPLAERPPTDINDDVKAWIAYVQGATDPGQLGDLPPDLRVSTARIDQWWQANCGKTLIG
jgi:hypothetical protein